MLEAGRIVRASTRRHSRDVVIAARAKSKMRREKVETPKNGVPGVMLSGTHSLVVLLLTVATALVATIAVLVA